MIRCLVFLLACFIWDGALAVTLGVDNYPRGAEPLVKPAFEPLPPGAVEPMGWLRD